MNDIERFLHRLVELLEARDPAGVHRPLSIDDLRLRVMPYRLNRSAIRLSSIEDYELMILRVVAEEGGFVRTFPPEAAERARTEVGEPNPDLEMVEFFGDTTIQIGANGLARLLTNAPPAPPPVAEADASAPSSEWAATVEASSDDRAGTEDAATGEAAESPAAESDEVELAFLDVDAEPAPAKAEPAPPPVFEPIADSIEVDEPSPAGNSDRSLGGYVRASVAICPFCGLSLPTHREVSFCPHCGDRLGPRRCVKCGSEVEKGWRHCITCGHAVGAGTIT